MKKGRLLRDIRRNADKYLLMLPFTVLFVLFTVVPVLSSILLSFTDFNMIQPMSFSGWSNYSRMFLDDDVFFIAVKNTLIFAVITGPVSYFLCLALAWMINEFGKVMRTLLTFVFYAPSISGTLYTVWAYIFSGDSNGLVNSALMRLGILYEPVLWLSDTRYMLTVIIIVQLWASLGTSFLAFIAGLQGVDRSLYEAGTIDGIRTRFQELRFITLPSMGPQLMFAAVMQIGAAFGVSTICVALAGNPSTDYGAATIVTHLSDVGTMRYEMGYASAIATVLFITMILVNGVIKRVLKKHTNI
jgi:ABC transporter, permease protein